MSTGARLDRNQLWVPSRVPPSLRTQSPDPACWTLEPGSQRRSGSQMARGLQSVLKGAFRSLSDGVEKGSRGRSLERAWGKFVLCCLIRHPQLWSGAVCRKPRGRKRREDPRWVMQGTEVAVIVSLAPCPLPKLFPPASELLSHLKPCMFKVPG